MSALSSNIGHTVGIALLTAIATGACPVSVPAKSALAVEQQWIIGGAGRWDYLTLDREGARLFVSRESRVDVIDTHGGKVIGTIPNTNGVHGIALAEELRRGFTSNGKADSITEFDIDTLKTVKEAPVSGHNPDAILYEPVGKHVFTFNGKSKDVTVLDAVSLAIIATLPVPDKPEFAVDDGEGQLFVNIESEPGQMVVIDSRKLAIKATWPLPGCASPSGLAIDKAHHRLFSVCDGKVMAVTDAVTGKQVATVKIGEGPDAAAFDAKRGLVFSSNADGTLTVVRQVTADRYQNAASVPTKRGARTMALDPANGKVYLVSANFAPAAAPSAEQPHPRPVPTPDSFTVLVVGAP
jgi:YVTN family beta-propeller protein